MKITTLLSAVLLAACSPSSVPDAFVATAHAAPAEAAASPQTPIDWVVDAKQSSLQAVGGAVGMTQTVVFADYTGTIRISGDTVSAVSYEVNMAGLTSNNDDLTAHLKNADFFDVPNHPKASFQSVEIVAAASANGASHTITGDLTIRGKTERVSFPAALKVEQGAVSATAEFSLNRQKFDVSYPGMKDYLIPDDVVLTIALVAPRD